MNKPLLRKFTDKELQDELATRKKLAVPKPLAEPNFKEAIKLAHEIVNNKANGVDDDDRDNWCFEALMQAVYGRDFWDWWNKQE